MTYGARLPYAPYIYFPGLESREGYLKSWKGLDTWGLGAFECILRAIDRVVQVHVRSPDLDALAVLRIQG